MRRLSRVSIVTVFAIALTQMAMAADLPRKAPAYTPPLPPVFSWTGFYVGGNAGWGWLRDSGGTFCINPAGILNGPGCNAQTATSDQIRGDGFICGAQAGYNWQINNWVLGIEADFQGAAIKGSVAAPIFLVAIPILSAIENAIEKLEWFGTVRGRLGVAFDRVFVYGTGGFAFLHPSQKPVGPPVVASNGHSPANGRPRSRVSTTISVRSLQLAALQTGLWWVKISMFAARSYGSV
jgi:outer membrane immunogenic protein